MQIPLSQLAQLARILVENYRERGYDTVPVDDMDMYWVIEAPEWTELSGAPKPCVGSLRDDWQHLQRVLAGEMPTAVDFNRLAAVLRAVSERIVR